MLVKQILKLKTNSAVHTIPADATLGEAAEELSARRIGVLVVSDDGRTVQGILSERDIVRELGRKGALCLADRVGDVMTRDIITCTCQEDGDTVLQRMNDGRFRHLPVMEDGVLLALLSQGDVVKAQLSELSMEKSALQDMIMGH
jgi:CBS domain-containing protein